MIDDLLTRKVIGCAIEIHRHFGPGLFESAYEDFLSIELRAVGLRYARQVPIVASYRGYVTERSYRADLIVEDKVLVEIKSVERFAPVHEAQVLTYLRIGGFPIGLLLNFNTVRLKDGIKRYAMRTVEN